MIGTKLKQLRKDNNVRPEDLAKLLSISLQAYYKYESNINEPNNENLLKMAQFFHITTDELLGNETNLINLKALDIDRARAIKDIINMPNNQFDRVDSYIKGITGQ